LVSINGKIVTELGTKVMYGDEVKFNDERINPEKKIYIILNKPKDYVTTLDDPEGRKTVMDLVKNACPERVYPVGRLDRNTTGLLLLTNDGDLTKKLTHPSYNKKKIYHVEVDQPISPENLDQIIKGIELEDGPIVVDSISYVDNLKTEVGIELHSGRNRIVRRIMEHFGYNVKRLDRVYFAGLTKLNLPRGRWRFLSNQEVIRLKTGMYE
jgi:23S rRNA pseudouridine2605 synthase